ncbi:hypothetical protein Bca101_091470 [Brassica carinata]
MVHDFSIFPFFTNIIAHSIKFTFSLGIDGSIWAPTYSSGYYEEILIRRNILMEYRGKTYSSEKTDEFRGYIIAVREPLGDFKNSEEIRFN